MNDFLNKFLNKFLNIQREELKLLCFSALFIFTLFFAYSILRPIRDALGLEGGKDELRYLFLATFFVCLLGSFTLMFLASRVKRRFYTDYVFLFFAFNLLIFYLLMQSFTPHSPAFILLSRVFFVWVSIFNLFAFSSAWSFIADIFNKEKSKRLFGIISAGASLGSVLGAALTKILVAFLGASNLIFISIALLISAVIFKNCILKTLNQFENQQSLKRFDEKIGAENPFSGFSLILKSPYLLTLCAFIFLLTAITTFLYMEQARVVRELFPTREARIAAFANIDLIVQSASLFIQIFLTAHIARFFGLKGLLCALGVVMGFGFIFLIFTHPAFMPIVLVMSLRRIGEYALVKPGREMLFVPMGADEKYKVKNFIDAVVYRAGDAASAQAEAVLAKSSIATVLFSGALLSWLWAFLGNKLANHYQRLT